MPTQPQLQRLGTEHGPAVLAFEIANRAYFAASISDRGDDFFEHFNDQYDELLAEQESGRDAYFVLVEGDGSVVGRFNLVDISDGGAELGYRVARRVAGRGVATAAVEEVCRLAASELGLSTLRARTTQDNIASQKVLTKAGFVPYCPTAIGGRPATWYRRDLSSQCHDRVMADVAEAEKDDLLRFLEYQRASVLSIVHGLDELAWHTAIVPSGWTPAGLVQHLGDAERHWFQVVVTGSEVDLPWDEGRPPYDEEAPFVSDWPGSAAVEYYRDQCRRSDEVLAVTPMSARPRGRHRGEEVSSVRWVVLHMIEETAAHSGHLEIARELLDGRTNLGLR